MSNTVVEPAARIDPSPVAGPRFRPDIEGLRAVAVGLVILFHAFEHPFTGGYVGVDVFFVISGFLITSLLLKERATSGKTSLADFYARRVRRILPASAVAVVATVAASYYFLGFVTGNMVAEDAKWTALFSANIHFGIAGSDYLAAQQPPSPLQHMWSLGVEEQFYVLWPALFALVALISRSARHRAALAVILTAVIAASLTWSVLETQSNATWAYFSPFTRAWELALGALIAVAIPAIVKIRQLWIPQAMAGIGLVGIAASALILTNLTPYPGWAVVFPVLSSGLLIAAGCANPATVVGQVLSVRPMQWLGARSYSLYIWHWPVLIIPLEALGHPLTVWQNAGLVALMIVLSALTYRFVENPIRHSHYLASRKWVTLLFGFLIIAATIGIAQWFIASNYGTWNPLIPV